jgi:hypothetical protein
MTPEQYARQQIDAKLGASCLIVQEYNSFSPSARRGTPLPPLAEQTRISKLWNYFNIHREDDLPNGERAEPWTVFVSPVLIYLGKLMSEYE